MALSTSRLDEEEHEEDWVDLEACLLGRTIHLHTLSPLFIPSTSGSTPDKRITKIDLESLSQRLHSHLTSRLSQLPFASSASIRSLGTQSTSNVVEAVRASFLERRELSNRNVPNPFLIEIQINQPSPIDTNPDRRVVEFAHLLFLSTPQRQTSSHYPILLWKAPPSGRGGIPDRQQDVGDVGVDFIPPPVPARLLTSSTLSFIATYFDCRMSTLAPLHGIRGRNLEDIAEKVMEVARSKTKTVSMEMTFAVPTQVPGDNGESIDGPAPDLNTINVSIPGPIAEEILDGVATFDTPIMPAIRHYLSSHTSIHLSKLTLTRVGIANVYLGAPTSAKTSGGEVRLKISREANDQSQEDMILTILAQLIRIAGEEEW